MPSTSHLPFSTAYTSSPAPSATSTSFTLTAPPTTATDIWRKPGPPAIKTFNAPLIYKSIRLSTFQRARVTVSAAWSRLYDQGGLVFILRDGKDSGSADEDLKWIKTGIEFYQGEAYVSTVVADRWADWSLVQAGIRDGKAVTLELERDGKEGTLWIYVVDGEKRIPVREVTWILSEAAETEVWIGVYTATPNADGKALEVQFSGWELEVTK
jgi:regulation of enolase protein 1 (concanavalin A-like superfamily)